MSRAARLEQAGKAFAAHLPSNATVELNDYANRVEVSWVEPDPEDSKRVVRYLATSTGENDGWMLRGPNSTTVIGDAAEWLRKRAEKVAPPAGPKVTLADIEAEKAEAPEPSADDLAEAIADAGQSYHRAREEESFAQAELDRVTEARRKLLTRVAQATQDRERAAEKLLAASVHARGQQPGPELTNWQDRLKAELQEVSGRLHKLRFLLAPSADMLTKYERDLLEQQRRAMAAYEAVLKKRAYKAGVCTCGDNEACASCHQGA